MTFWRPPKKTLSGDFASEFGSHSKFGKKLDDQHETNRLKTVSSWQSGESSNLGSKPKVLIKKCPGVMKAVSESFKRRYYEAKQQEINKENISVFKLNKPFKNQSENDYITSNSVNKFFCSENFINASNNDQIKVSNEIDKEEMADTKNHKKQEIIVESQSEIMQNDLHKNSKDTSFNVLSNFDMMSPLAINQNKQNEIYERKTVNPNFYSGSVKGKPPLSKTSSFTQQGFFNKSPRNENSNKNRIKIDRNIDQILSNASYPKKSSDNKKGPDSNRVYKKNKSFEKWYDKPYIDSLKSNDVCEFYCMNRINLFDREDKTNRQFLKTNVDKSITDTQTEQDFKANIDQESIFHKPNNFHKLKNNFCTNNNQDNSLSMKNKLDLSKITNLQKDKKSNIKTRTERENVKTSSYRTERLSINKLDFSEKMTSNDNMTNYSRSTRNNPNLTRELIEYNELNRKIFNQSKYHSLKNFNTRIRTHNSINFCHKPSEASFQKQSVDREKDSAKNSCQRNNLNKMLHKQNKDLLDIKLQKNTSVENTNDNITDQNVDPGRLSKNILALKNSYFIDKFDKASKNDDFDNERHSFKYSTDSHTRNLSNGSFKISAGFNKRNKLHSRNVSTSYNRTLSIEAKKNIEKSSSKYHIKHERYKSYEVKRNVSYENLEEKPVEKNTKKDNINIQDNFVQKNTLKRSGGIENFLTQKSSGVLGYRSENDDFCNKKTILEGVVSENKKLFNNSKSNLCFDKNKENNSGFNRKFSGLFMKKHKVKLQSDRPFASNRQRDNEIKDNLRKKLTVDFN